MAELPLAAAWQRATHRLIAGLDAALSELGLSPAEVNALACFGDRDAVSVRELVEATGQRPSTLTGVLDRLERRGLVTRAVDPGDRRSVLAELTADGRRSAGAIAAAFAEVERRLPAPAGVRAAVAAVEAVAGSLGRSPRRGTAHAGDGGEPFAPAGRPR